MGVCIDLKKLSVLFVFGRKRGDDRFTDGTGGAEADDFLLVSVAHNAIVYLIFKLASFFKNCPRKWLSSRFLGVK
jgi:hypothetical protein